MGINWRDDDPFELGLEQLTLAEMIKLSPSFSYYTSFVGKWHLSTLQATGFSHPLDQGWDFYAGAFAGTLDFGDGPHTSIPSGKNDAFVAKLPKNPG